MSGVALCRLPTQMCEGCSEAFPDEQLDTLYRNDSALYCGAYALATLKGIGK